MKKCKNCGALMGDDLNICPKCNTPYSENDKAYDFGRQAGEQFGAFVGGDHSAEFDPAEVQKYKVLCALSYTGLFFLPFFGSVNSPYCRFHANQSFFVFLFAIVFSIVKGILNTLTHIPLLGFIFGIADWAVVTVFSVIQLALFLYGLINTLSGRSKELPIVGGVRIIK